MAANTRTRMIEAAARLAQARGFHGVSLNDVLAESGAPRGSLYFHFPGGKTELILEAMQSGIEEATRELEDCLDASDDPAEGVRSFFIAAAREMVDSNYAFGCPVAPIVLDRPGPDSELARACQAAFDQWEQMYREALESAGLPTGKALRLARTILASLEGALLMARSKQSAEPIEQIGEEMARLVAGALSAERPPA